MITRLVEDALDESARRLAALGPESPDDIRSADGQVVAFSSAMSAVDLSLKAFLFPNLYKHPRLMSVRRDAESIVRDLFARFVREPAAMPDGWGVGLAEAPPEAAARRVADYIAGMTDRYAVEEHRRLFPHTPELRIA